MKSLLTVTAFFEAATGIGLAAAPSMLVPILLGVVLDEPAAIILGRMAGASLITLAIACWLSRNNGQYAAVIVKAMLFYNIAAIIVLVYAGLGLHFSGMGLWPAVVAHVGLAAWCLASLQKKQTQGSV